MVDVIAFSLRVAVGVVLATAAFAKAKDPAAFRDTLAALRVPSPIRSATAFVVVVAEAVVGGYLLSGAESDLADAVSLVTLGALVSVSLYAAVTDTDVPCACFGRGKRNLGFETLLLSTLLFAAQAFSTSVLQIHGVGWRTSVLQTEVVVCFALSGILIGLWVISGPSFFRIYRERRHVAGEL